MTIKYKLNKDLISRAAMQLNWELKDIRSEVELIGARKVNAKSLIGILSGNFRKNDNIKIVFNLPEEKEQILTIFNTIGEQQND